MLQDRGLSSQPGLLERVLQLKETHCSPYLLAFLFDCYEDTLESGSLKNPEQEQETLIKALEVRLGKSSRIKSLLFQMAKPLWFDLNSSCFPARFVNF